jgi:hypothetical protein
MAALAEQRPAVEREVVGPGGSSTLSGDFLAVVVQEPEPGMARRVGAD